MTKTWPDTALPLTYLSYLTDLFPFHVLLQASKTAENATGQPTEDTEAAE